MYVSPEWIKRIELASDFAGLGARQSLQPPPRRHSSTGRSVFRDDGDGHSSPVPSFDAVI